MVGKRGCRAARERGGWAGERGDGWVAGWLGGLGGGRGHMPGARKQRIAVRLGGGRRKK